MERKAITRFDIILISLIITVLGFFFIYQAFMDDSSKTAVIIVNGETVNTIDLNTLTDKQQIKLENGVVIAAEKDKVFFEDSPCKDKLCVKCGELTDVFDTSVCVPTKTVVKIIGDDTQKIDIMTY